MTALQYFRLLAPEFASISDAIVNQWLTIAEMFVPTGCIDAEKYAMATALYAAHLIKQSIVSASGGAVGPVTMEKEGDLARSYGTTKGDDSVLGSTTYGLQYMQVTAACYGSAIMTRYGISGTVR
jgi:hypothetical protein